MQHEQSEDRRKARRHRLCLVVHLRTADGDARTAVVRDASASGAFVLTRGSNIDVGTPVEIEVVPLQDGAPAPTVRGQIVRAGTWEAGDLWRQGLGVSFEGALPATLPIEEIAAQQASWV